MGAAFVFLQLQLARSLPRILPALLRGRRILVRLCCREFTRLLEIMGDAFVLRKVVQLIVLLLILNFLIASTSSYLSEASPEERNTSPCRRALFYSRPTTIEPDSIHCEAASREFLRLLECPEMAQIRLDLAAIYQLGGGFMSTAAFYKASFDFMHGIGQRYELPENTALPLSCNSLLHGPDALSGSIFEPPDTDMRISAQIADSLRRRSSPEMIVSDLERMMSDRGPRCAVLCEWAAAILELAQRDESADGAREEAAVAILISMAQNNRFPLHHVGRPAVYLEIARYFRHRGDLISASTAAKIALHYANQVSDIFRSQDGAFSEIQSLIKQIEAEEDASDGVAAGDNQKCQVLTGDSVQVTTGGKTEDV